MSDLVERLRNVASGWNSRCIHTEAADRIEELEKSLTLCSTHCEWQAKRIEVLEGALRNIRTELEEARCGENDPEIVASQLIIRAALSPTPKEE